MIKINLLPEEYIVEDRTSPTRILVISASVLMGVVSFIFFLVVHFHILETASEQLKKAKTIRAGLKKFETQNQTLHRLIRSFETRDEAVEMVKAMRISFSQKLYQFSELLHQGIHPVWLNNLSIDAGKLKTQGRKKKKKKTVSIPVFNWKASCICASESLKSATGFYKALKKDKPFFKDFIQTTVPVYAQKILGQEYQQKYGWAFNLAMTMQVRPPEKKDKKRR